MNQSLLAMCISSVTSQSTCRHLLLMYFCGLGIKLKQYLCIVGLSLFCRSFFDITSNLKGFHLEDFFQQHLYCKSMFILWCAKMRWYIQIFLICISQQCWKCSEWGRLGIIRFRESSIFRPLNKQLHSSADYCNNKYSFMEHLCPKASSKAHLKCQCTAISSASHHIALAELGKNCPQNSPANNQSLQGQW